MLGEVHRGFNGLQVLEVGNLQTLRTVDHSFAVSSVVDLQTVLAFELRSYQRDGHLVVSQVRSDGVTDTTSVLREDLGQCRKRSAQVERFHRQDTSLLFERDLH
ncbi:hypothetical protein D3C76_1465570 [compost metagenome]